MQAPPSDTYRLLLRPPRVVVWLLVSFLAVLGYMMVLPQDRLQNFVDAYAFVPANLTASRVENAHTPGEWAALFGPLISYSFLHGGLIHLLLNGVGFLVVATVAARRMGDASFLAFCIVTGIFAGLTHWAFHIGSTTPMVGASGMLSGLIGATARFVTLDLRGVWGRAGGLLPLSDRRLLGFTAMWMLLNYMFGIVGFGASGPEQSVAWEAHMGGYFAGMLLYPLFDWRRPYRTADMLVYEEIP